MVLSFRRNSVSPCHARTFTISPSISEDNQSRTSDDYARVRKEHTQESERVGRVSNSHLPRRHSSPSLSHSGQLCLPRQAPSAHAGARTKAGQRRPPPTNTPLAHCPLAGKQTGIFVTRRTLAALPAASNTRVQRSRSRLRTEYLEDRPLPSLPNQLPAAPPGTVPPPKPATASVGRRTAA